MLSMGFRVKFQIVLWVFLRVSAIISISDKKLLCDNEKSCQNRRILLLGSRSTRVVHLKKRNLTKRDEPKRGSQSGKRHFLESHCSRIQLLVIGVSLREETPFLLVAYLQSYGSTKPFVVASLQDVTVFAGSHLQRTRLRCALRVLCSLVISLSPIFRFRTFFSEIQRHRESDNSIENPIWALALITS